MRNFVIAAALLVTAALVPGAPAQAAVGCQCMKIGAPSACMPSVIACNTKMGGVCVAPCSYTESKAQKSVKRHMARASAHPPAKKHQVAKKTAPKKKEKKM
jgi:hypothetical protein